MLSESISMIIKNLEKKLEDSKEVLNHKLNMIESKRKKKDKQFLKINDRSSLYLNITAIIFNIINELF